MTSFKVLLFLGCVMYGIWGVAAQDTSCAGAPQPRLMVNGAGRVLPGEANNLRALPNLNGEKVGKIPGGETFTTMEGPVCADGLNWWQVDYNGLIGWTVEGQGSDYWVEPLSPAELSAETVISSLPVSLFKPPLPAINQLVVGVQARVLDEETEYESLNPALRSLYTEPTINSATIVPLVADQIVTVVGGPHDEGSWRWWQVQTQDGTQGWTVEGISQIRHLLPACPKTENRVVYTADFYIYTADDNGGSPCIFDLLHVLTNPMWSPDRRSLLFVNYPVTYTPFGKVYEISADGLHRTVRVSNKYTLSLDYSPDGQKLVSVEYDDLNVEVWVQNVNTPDPEKVRLTTGRRNMGWAGWLDNDTILFWDALDNGHGGATFSTISLSQGTETVLFESVVPVYNADGVRSSYAIRLSPNRQQVLIVGPVESDTFGDSQTIVYDTRTGAQIARFSDSLNDWSPGGTEIFTLRRSSLIKASVAANAEPVIIQLSEPPTTETNYGDSISIEWVAEGVVRYAIRGTVYFINPTTGEVTLRSEG